MAVNVNTIKNIIGIPATNKDTVIEYLISNATGFVMDYCNIDSISGMDNVLIKMVLEDFNRNGNDGLSSQSFSGVSESYNQDYSEQIYKTLNKHRKIKML